jgi:hypothetical protein
MTYIKADSPFEVNMLFMLFINLMAFIPALCLTTPDPDSILMAFVHAAFHGYLSDFQLEEKIRS